MKRLTLKGLQLLWYNKIIKRRKVVLKVMRMVDLIAKKQNGVELAANEMNWMIENYTNEQIPDYQMSAFIMAVYFNGMGVEELSIFTEAIVKSGDEIDLSAIEGTTVDKHSTGGVGDTTSLILAPLVASVGVPVAKMSGRGLGHTGGTIDKLEAIEGFNIELDQDEFISLVNKNKLALVGQSGNLTPADKKLYALRDVTSTVQSIPLIASSIMSKKIASGADSIVLDVKTGSGAFMKNDKEAAKLAETMVNIGNNTGRKTMAVISDMSQPLGRAIGNSLEVKEAMDTLRGEGPEDLMELCLSLGSQMVYLGGGSSSLDEARNILEENIKNGKAIEKFKTFVEAQGGNPAVVDQPDLLPQAGKVVEVNSEESGVVSEIVADKIGVAAMVLGAGRETKESQIDLSAGIMLNKKIGDQVEKGELLATLYTNKEDTQEAADNLLTNIKISDQADKPKLIHKIIEG